MRPILVAVCFVFVAISIAGCGRKTGNPSGSTTSSSGGGAGSSGAEIVVGEYGSMSGDQKTFGVSTHNGIMLAVNQINAKGGIHGKKIDLEKVDDQGKPDLTATLVSDLILKKHSVALLGEVASSLSQVGGKLAQNNGVPMISPSSTNPSVTKIGKMVSRVCYIDPYQGKVCADFAFKELKLTKAAIIYDKSQAYSTGLQKNFADAFKADGGTIVAVEAIKSDDIEFSAQLTTIKAANPQIIFAPVYYKQITSIAPDARKLGITVPFLGADGWVSETLKDAGDALDGCYFSDHYAKEDTSPEVTSFLTAYRDTYHSEPDSMAALGYDAANLLFDSMGRAKTLSGTDLSAAINSTKEFHGVTGVITIDADRNASKGCVIQVIDKQGDYKLFSKIAAPHS